MYILYGPMDMELNSWQSAATQLRIQWPLLSAKENFQDAQQMPETSDSIKPYILFFSFLAILWHREFLGQGSDLSHDCKLCCSYGNATSLGINPSCPDFTETRPIPPHHSGNTYILFFPMLMGRQCLQNGYIGQRNDSCPKQDRAGQQQT